MRYCVIAAAIAASSPLVQARQCESWTQIPSTGAVPSGYTYGAVYDSTRDRVVAVIGGTAACNPNPIREYDGSNWVGFDPPIGPAGGNWSVTFDSVRGRTVLFGGDVCGPTNPVDQHWEWNGSTWTARQIPRPSARRGAALVFDANRGKCVLFGGDGGSGPLNDLWEYDGSVWTQLVAPGGPSPRAGMATAFDPVGQRVVFFGGRTSSAIPGGIWYDETWAWDGVAWQRLASIGDPQLPLNYEMARDATTGRLIMYAFYNGSAKCYAFDGVAWTTMNIAGPPQSAWCGYVSDTLRRRILLFSGHSLSSQMWKYSAEPGPVFDQHPSGDSLRLGESLQLSVALSGEPNPTLRWHRNGSPLFNGGRISGVTTTHLIINSVEPADTGAYTCVATGSACARTSLAAPVVIWCWADLDGGSSPGVPDGGVAIEDLLFFLAAFEDGSTAADLDNDGDPAIGFPDGGVDINDLLFFLAHFEAGC